MQQQQNKWHHWHVCTAELKHPENSFSCECFALVWGQVRCLTVTKRVDDSWRFSPFWQVSSQSLKNEKMMGTVIPAGLFLQPPLPLNFLHGEFGWEKPVRIWVGQELSMEKGSDEPTHHSLKHGWPHMDKIKTDGFLWFNDLARSIGSFVSNKFQKR